MEPQPMPPESAKLFDAPKSSVFLDGAGPTGGVIRQTGGAYLESAGAEPVLAWPTEIVTDEPLIETFVVDADANCVGTGPDDELVHAWFPAASRLSRRVLDAVSAFDIALSGPAYLTATVTPSDQITGLAHFDDDLYQPTDGVGFVAIVATLAGPRVAIEPLPLTQPPPGAQLVLSDAVIKRFDSARSAACALPVQYGAADRIVVFPQFGQLHAGPVVADARRDLMRYLLVFRSATTPS